MRTFILALITCLPIFSYCQRLTPQPDLADSGKLEFKLQAKKDTPDYSIAIRMLTSQVRMNPKNAELRYFLGYALDRLNANDAEWMPKQQKGLAIKASEQFEEVIKLEPTYKGEMVLLDPYSKITSTWGSMAYTYLNDNRDDSAKWALREGRRRGGFINPLLEYNRQILYSCDPHAILFTRGDVLTFSCLYLQELENVRKDVTVIDLNLFSSKWFPKYLKRHKLIKLPYDDAQIDSMEYKVWTAQPVTVEDPSDSGRHYSWILKPTYQNGYILRGDILLASTVQANYFDRPIYFDNAIDSTQEDFLDSFLVSKGLANKLNFGDNGEANDTTKAEKLLLNYSMADVRHDELLRSPDAINSLNGFRTAYAQAIYRFYQKGYIECCKRLENEMNQRFSPANLPYATPEVKKFFEDLTAALVSEK